MYLEGFRIFSNRQTFSGEKQGNAFVLQLFALVNGVANGEHAGVVQASHIRDRLLAKKTALLDKLAFEGGRDDTSSPRAGVANYHVLLEFAGANPHKGDPVRLLFGSMLACKSYKTKPEKSA